MAYNLSTVFSFQDQMTSKLAGIVKEGKNAATAFNDVGTAIDKAFKTSSVIQFETKAASSFDKLGNTVMDSSKTMERSIDDAFDDMSNSVKKLDDNFNKLGSNSIPDTSREIGNLGDESSDTEKALGRLDNQSFNLGSTIRTLAGIVGTAFAVNKVKDFAEDTLKSYIEFESSMKEVYTLLPGITKDGMDKMEQQVSSFDQSMGTLSSESIPALYEALSSGVPQDTIFDFLEVANKAAVGGVTELETTVNGLTSVINAYGSDTIDVGTASDLMFQAVKLGKTTFDELSNSLYNVNPTAAAAGVNFGDVSAALAAMTAQGVPTAVATTQLRQALVELTKTGTDTDEIFRKISGESFKDFIAGGGDMQDAFQLLEQYADKSNLGINDLFGSVEAGNAVLALTGKGTDLFTQSMEAMDQAAGSTEAAFDVMTESVSHKMDVLGSTWESIKLSAGESLGEAISPLADDLSENLDEIKQPISDIFSMLGDAASKAGTKIPTVLRGISDGLDNLGDKAGPIFSWIEDNPNLIGTSLAGIGSAIVSYKIISALPQLAAGFKAVGAALTGNPWGLVATALITAIVTVGTAIKNQEKELKQASLDEHFGSITLSLEDLEGAASHILKSDVVDKLSASLKSLDTINELAGSIDNSIAEINKMDWKVSIGMKLTEDEKQGYIASVESFIKDSQDLLSEAQYSMSINMQMFTDDSMEGNTIEAAMNGFFQRNQATVAELGTQLQEAVNKAFEDGLLDVDEAKVIANYMQEIANLTDAISQSKFEASLERISIDYSGKNLTDDSFMQLQEELNKQVEERISGIRESFDNTLAYYGRAYNAGDMSEELYNEAKAMAEEKYLSAIGDAELKSSNYMMDTVMSAYQDELGAVMPEFEKYVDEALQGSTDYINSGLDNMVLNWDVLFSDIEDFKGLDKTTKAALTELFEKIQPSVEMLNELKNQYKEYGMEIPNAINEGLVKAATLGALTEDYDSIWTVLGNAAAGSEEHTKAIEKVKENGWYVPEELANAIEENVAAVELPIDGMYSYTERYFNQVFSDGFSFDLPISLGAKYKLTEPNLPEGWAALADPFSSLGGHADGGIFDTPHVAWFAEDGPEAAIPLDGSDNAKELWEATGRMLGLYDSLEIPAYSNSPEDVKTVSNNGDITKSIYENKLTIEFKGIGSIDVNRNMTKADIIDTIYEHIRPAFFKALNEDILEEGDVVYEY